MTYSVLVVDDYEPWRRRVAAELDKSGRWRVVGECEDGGEAVLEASARKPDLIILDIGLKTMNGVEAARRIIADDPGARILFLTGQQSPEVAEAALATGARAYLLKPEAGGALLRAVEAVAAGARFISAGLPPEVVDAITPPVNGHSHHAAFHSNNAALVYEYARFAENALGRAQPVLIIAPRASLARVREELEARGVQIERAIRAGRYEAFDVESELSKLMPDGRYDRERFRGAAVSMLDNAAKKAGGGRRAAACGEIAPQLWRSGRGDTAIDIERVWDETARATGADVLCGYCVDGARLEERDYTVFRDICALHGAAYVR